MITKISISRDTVLKILDAVFSLAALPLMIYGDYKGSGAFLLFNVSLFAVLCVARVFQALRLKYDSQRYAWSLVKAGAYLLCALLLLVIPDRETAKKVIGILLMVTLFAEIVQYVWRNHSFNSIFFNLICVFTLIFVIRGDYYRVLIYILVQVVVHIVCLSFSQMNLKLLIKVIRKTYAANVMGGLLLLMAAASFTIPALEESIPTFKDAVWYCFSILTNIGFADYAAATDAGKVISLLLGVYGIIVVALITSIIVNFYTEVKNEPDGAESDQPV